MEILEFVKLEEMDPIYFDASYFMTPEDAGKKAYALLMKAMQESGYGAIAKLTMHQRENIVLMRPRANGLTLHTMYYENEVRQVEEYGKDANIQLKDQEKKLALQLIESLAAPFQPEKYHDAYQTALKGLIDAKLKGEEVAEAQHPKLAPVIDLMDALKKSLAEKPHAPAAETAPKKRPPMRVVPAETAEEEPARGQRRKKSAG